MDHICLIGAGESGLRFIEECRKRNRTLSITLIDTRQHYFQRTNLFDWWSGNFGCRIVDLADFCEKNSATFIKAKVERINFRTRRIFLKDQDHQEFKTLVIASGVVSRDIEIKGDFREGFFYLSDIEPFRVRELLTVSDDAIVFVSTVLGLRLALALTKMGKETRVIIKDAGFLAGYEEPITAFLRSKSIDVCIGCSIEEVIGESMVKATKVSIPKVFSSQLVFVDSGFIPNTKFLETPLTFHDVFCTEHEGVYCLGEMLNKDVAHERFFMRNAFEAQQQAACLAEHIITRKPHNYTRNASSLDDKTRVFEEILKYRLPMVL